MPPGEPTLFVAHFPDRQVDRVRAPQRILSRDRQVRSAAEALRVVVSGRLRIRDAQCDMKPLRRSPLKAAGDEVKLVLETDKPQGTRSSNDPSGLLRSFQHPNQNHLTLEMT